MTTPGNIIPEDESLHDRVLREVPDAAKTTVGKRILKELKTGSPELTIEQVNAMIKGLMTAVEREKAGEGAAPISGGKQVKKRADLDALDGNTGNDTTPEKFSEKFNKGWKNAR